MMIVCFSHFGDAYFGPLDANPSLGVIRRLTLVATPTFMIISGMMLGLLYGRHEQSFGRLRDKLVDRGLFLLTVGHVIITPAHYFRAGNSWIGTTHYAFITDTIAFAAVIGPLLITRLNASTRVITGLALYVTSWVVALAWQPQIPALHVLKDLFVGPNGQSPWKYTFPLLPWFGVYLGSSAIGTWLARQAAIGRFRDAARTFALAGAGAIAIAAVSYTIARLTEATHAVASATVTGVHQLTSPLQKWPPGPGYLLAYGGAGLLVAATCIVVDDHPRLRAITTQLAVLGRTSLFIFVLQYYVYWVVILPLHLPYTPWWPAYYIVSMGLIFAAARAWDARGWNRYFTVGYADAGRGLLAVNPSET